VEEFPTLGGYAHATTWAFDKNWNAKSRVAPVSVIHDERLRGHGCRPRRSAYVATNSAPVSFRVRCLAPPIPVAVAAPPMPVATPIPRGVGIYWLRNHGRCVIARHHWSCVDGSWHHVDCRWCINRGCIDRRCRVRRWGRRCVPIGRFRQISDRFCVAVVRSRINLGRCAGRWKCQNGCAENESFTHHQSPSSCLCCTDVAPVTFNEDWASWFEMYDAILDNPVG